MKVHLAELELAHEYNGSHALEHLDAGQVKQVMSRGRKLHKWFKAHPALHIVISISVIASIFAMDWLGWIALSRWFVASHPGLPALILVAILTGIAHSWLLYSLSSYALHEGAAHNLIFPGKGPVSRAASFLSTNMCRLATAEPEH